MYRGGIPNDTTKQEKEKIVSTYFTLQLLQKKALAALRYTF